MASLAAPQSSLRFLHALLLSYALTEPPLEVISLHVHSEYSIALQSYVTQSRTQYNNYTRGIRRTHPKGAPMRYSEERPVAMKNAVACEWA
ncbi:hypothetical protein BD414DRAFT_293901 [Trametes punicea]|nr:hypothetical protein BD414DRAFT_293901 [Trametes punicea]